MCLERNKKGQKISKLQLEFMHMQYVVVYFNLMLLVLAQLY